jgi:hypothetical protein
MTDPNPVYTQLLAELALDEPLESAEEPSEPE